MKLSDLVPICSFSLNLNISEDGVKYFTTSSEVLVNTTNAGIRFVGLDNERPTFFWIPSGISTNLGSVPWIARWLVSPTSPAIVVPAVIHDYITGEYDLDFDFIAVTLNGTVYVTKTAVLKYLITWLSAKEGTLVDVGKDAVSVQIPWAVSAELFKRIGRAFSGKANKVQVSLAYAAVWLYGKVKRLY